MSDKPGTSPQIINLPSGGGALKGIGESFSADPFTGTGRLTVPILLPPGRNGFQPHLALDYGSAHGNGPFGLGWSLTLPELTRKTAKGVPRYLDDAADPTDRDSFLLGGEDDLLEVARPAAGATRYRPRTEKLFASIERLRNSDGDIWRVRGKDGLESRYGDVGAHGDPTVVVDPHRPGRIFAWKLTETRDPFGNRIVYEYLRDRGADGPHDWDQLYLQTISYVDVADPVRPFLVSVSFVHTPRPDPYSEHRAGFEVRTRLRCTGIEVRSHAGDDRLVRRYELTYVDQQVAAGSVPADRLPRNGVSLLGQIRCVGVDGDTTEALPPLGLRYTTFAPEQQRFRPIQAATGPLPEQSLADAQLELVSLHGNGLPDLVHMDGPIQIWRNLGDGTFDGPRLMAEAPPVQLSHPGVRFADLSGSGRADLLVLPQAGYYPLSLQGRWGQEGFVRYAQAPTIDFGDGELRLMDLDGDGVTDALRTGASFELFYSDPVSGWNHVETRTRGPVEEFPDVSFSDPRVKLADMTGDGLQDIVFVQQGRIDYWPYLGHGAWGRRVTMAASPIFQDSVPVPGLGFDPRRVLLGDVDGDGAADLAYVEPGRITIWINQAGAGWSSPIVVEGTPTVTEADAVRLVDLLGSGAAGVLWTDRIAGQGAGYQFLDFTGATKPYVLQQIDNHCGAVTEIWYSPSTRFYREDARADVTRWRTALPFPVQVVARVETTDRISGGGLTSEYRYRHGYWDGREREFRGFGLVEHVDSPTGVAAVPVRTKSWFHLGAVEDELGNFAEADFTSEYWPGDPAALARPPAMRGFLDKLSHDARRRALRSLRGAPLRTETYALDGSDRETRPYAVTEELHGVVGLPVGAAWPERPEPWQETVFFPHLLARREAQWERGTEPLVQFELSDDHDTYGQARSSISLALARTADGPCLAQQRLTTLAQRDDVGRYLVDRIASATTLEIVGEKGWNLDDLHARILDGRAQRRVVAQTLHYYDGPAFDGLPLGQIGDTGALARTEVLVLTAELLQAAYPVDDGIGAPPYLNDTGPPSWSAEYPAGFRDATPPSAGYVRHVVGGASEDGWFAVAESRQVDSRGLVTASRDPLGRETRIQHDAFDLLPVEVILPAAVPGAADVATRATYDYRAFAPARTEDANGNATAYGYSPLGAVASVAVLGKGDDPGDTVAEPGTRYFYDFDAYALRSQPISVHTIRRVNHVKSPDLAQHDDTLEKRDYSDGFGRLVQSRTLAEDVLLGDPRWGDAGLPFDQASNGPAVGRARADGAPVNVVVSGWQVYDGKGRVVEKYEPAFATGWEYHPPVAADLGRTVALRYDPLGRLVGTVNPDGSEQTVVFGEPNDLATPDAFRPTPWTVYTYDANDNGGRTHPDSSAACRGHWNTPTSITRDALGRTVEKVERNDPDPAADWMITLSSHDIRGNLVAVIDSLGRRAVEQVFDLMDRVVRTLDAGRRRRAARAGCRRQSGRASRSKGCPGSDHVRWPGSIRRDVGT